MEDPAQPDAARPFSEPGKERTPLVFVVDDEKPNRILMERAVRDQGYNLDVFADGVEAVEAIEAGASPDLVISDIVMPRLNGLDLCHYVKSHERLHFVPVILVTALSAVEDKVRGLERGADDFLHKPFHPLELKARVRSLLRIKALHDRMEDQNRLLGEERVHLERLVAERTRELNDITIGLVSSLERVNELNDNDTGKHIIRVCEFWRMLAEGCNLDGEMVQKVRRYSSLHDVGKVGIRDDILKKEGPLTPEEWEEMKRHSEIGYELLKLAHADPIAKNIARYHHEKWSGAGYPVGLSGTDIPVEARIVALADVYDALTTRRCYKPAFSVEQTEKIISKERGKHFDPDLVDLYFELHKEFDAIRVRYRDTEG